MLYEGYAAGGVAVICTILTDNRNRTASDLRFIFTKNGGSLGPGRVAWQFDRKGVIGSRRRASTRTPSWRSP